MNKKALACLLAAAMTISLTACGGGDKKTSDKAQNTENTSLEATNQLIEAEDPSALPETAAKRKVLQILQEYSIQCTGNQTRISKW